MSVCGWGGVEGRLSQQMVIRRDISFIESLAQDLICCRYASSGASVSPWYNIRANVVICLTSLVSCFVFTFSGVVER